MGISGLTNVIKRVAPEAMEYKDISELKGKRVAIDMSLVTYQCLISLRFNHNKFMDSEGKNTSHIYGIFNRFVEYLRLGIIPIGVFDGKPPDAKKNTIDSRNKEVSDSKSKIEELKKLEQTIEVKQKIWDLEKKSVKMTWQHGQDLKELLKLMGIKTYQANGEAEAAAVWLVKNGLADTIMTEDMDTLVYGNPGMDFTLIRRKVSRNSSPNEIVIFHLDIILEKMQLTMDQFVDMCLLCGSDYTSSIPRIGSRTAYSLIMKHNNLENVLDILRNKPNATGIPTDEEYKIAKNIFTKENNNLIYKDELTTTTLEPKLETLKSYLLNKNFNEKRINTALKKAY